MAHINVQIPDEMAADVEEHVEASGRYLNQSEYVRDALRHKLEADPLRLSAETLRAIETSERQVENGETVNAATARERLGIED